MHPKVKQALEEIDAAVFNGDTFDEESARKELVTYIARWRRRIAEDVEAPDTFEVYGDTQADDVINWMNKILTPLGLYIDDTTEQVGAEDYCVFTVKEVG